MSYIPSAELLDSYADVLVRFALGSGEGIKPGDVVLIQVPECAKPFLLPLQQSVLRAGGHPMVQLLPDGVLAQFLNTASAEQLQFAPTHYFEGLVGQIDHQIRILAEADKYELREVEPSRVVSMQRARKQWMQLRNEKENRGAFTWTLALYGTEAMASEVGMSLEEYWQQIISACFLDTKNPIETWKNTYTELERIRKELNSLSIDSVHIAAEGTDITVGIGENRSWLGGSGRNIPSFELFISPDCRRTEGVVAFNQPLYRYGNVLKGINLTFKDGVIVSATAEQGQELLDELLATEGARMIGEFSLTDKRFSNITKPMGETLFDENMGGEHGNMHLAVGAAYKDSYPGDISAISQEQFTAWGYNDSAEHCDIITTAPRKVMATLTDGSEILLYENGKFAL